MAGKFTVVCGPMFSGKTEELMRRCRRAFFADMGVQIFSPSTDTRHEGKLISHAGTDINNMQMPFHVTLVGPKDQFAMRVRANVKFVALDEVQFFDRVVISEIEHLLHARNVTVVACGLDRDFRNTPFGVMPELLALADEVVKLSAICTDCRRDNATISHRLVANEEQVLVGASESYTPLCRSCWCERVAR